MVNSEGQKPLSPQNKTLSMPLNQYQLKINAWSLKALSYHAYISSMRGDNEVKRFYRQSLQRTLNRKHARLNTQRKIITVMYSIWKKGSAYRPELFLDPAT